MPIAAVIFFLVPIIEMVILIKVGGILGILPTIGLVVLTAVAGVWLLRLEGIATINRVQQKLSMGEIPETELLEGVMLIVGGALLLTPGFATDFAGFVCLIPGLRRPLARHLINSAGFRQFSMHRNFGSQSTTGFEYYRQETRSNGQVIDGEFQPAEKTPLDKKDS